MSLFYRLIKGSLVLCLLVQLSCFVHRANGAQEVLFQLDFTQIEGDARKWLSGQGFKLQKAMTDDNKLNVSTYQKDQGLLLSSLEPSLGFALLPGMALHGVGYIEIEWGILRYPENATWEEGVNREAIMVQLFFGEKVKADKIYLPDSPHFIGLFLGENDPLNTPFIGKSYQKTARFVCLDNPAPGKITTSRADAHSMFKQFFKVHDVPFISGLGIEVDTSNLVDGRSSAILKKITIFKRSVEGN